jgi:imidazolonepropionase-like amidohydrolase
LALTGFHAPGTSAATVLFENVTLIDGTGRPPQPVASVLVEGDRIAAVSPGRIAAPAGAERIDGAGKFLLPGLINTHVHLAGGRTGPRNSQMIEDVETGQYVLHGFLYSGVTSIYDSGNNVDYIFRMRDDERTGRITSPRIFATGRLFTRSDGYQCCAGGYQVKELADGLAKLDELMARKPDMIKFIRERRGMGAKSAGLPMVPLDVLNALITRANDNGFRTTVHVSEESLARESIEAGVDALAHPVYLMETRDEFARYVAVNRIPVSTTMGRVDADPAIFDRPQFVATMTERERKAGQTSPMYFGTPAGRWRSELMKAVMHNIKQFFDAGVILALGTDRSTGPFVARELELLVQAGIPPLEAIKIGTLNAAIYMGKEADLGTVERGKLADLLLLSADPATDVRNVEAIVEVYKGGRRIDRGALDLPINGRRPSHEGDSAE